MSLDGSSAENPGDGLIRAGSGSRLGIRGWIYATIGAMSVLVVLFSVIGGVLLARTSQASDLLVDRIGPANTALADTQDALVDQETGVRGYLLTRQSDFLQPYTQGEAQEAADSKQIETLLAGHTAALADFATLAHVIAAWKATYALPLITDAQAGKPITDGELNASKDSFDGLRRQFGTLNTELGAERAADVANLHRLDQIRDRTLIAMLVVFFATVALIVVLIQFAVLRPLTRLRLESEAVTEGNFDSPLTATGPRDIRALGEALAAMRGRLTRALAAAERQRTTLHEQKEALDSQAADLRRSNEELEQFAYVASHDLQEPLRKVASFCQLIERRYAEHLDERGKQYIDYAVDGAKRMQVLINDLLTFSRVGRVNERHQRVELKAAVDDAIYGLQYAVNDTGARIEVEEGLPAVTGDPTLIRMLLQNLIGNSLKFHTPEQPPEIDISLESDPQQPGFVQLSVADRGIGIPAEFSEKVFVIFQRLHSRESYTGTGIGLALCKKIVEYHGGRIAIDAEHTPGTRIVFSLPAAEPSPEPESAPEPEPESRSESESSPEPEQPTSAPESVPEPESSPEPAPAPAVREIPKPSASMDPGAEPAERASQQ
jgi:signal transduction histidine kinase